MPGIVVRLELSLELLVRFCVNARHCGRTGTKSGAFCEVLCKCQALWSDWN